MHQRLLLIEDDDDLAEMLGIYFTDQQYDFFHAPTGLEGVEMAFNRFPSLILLDVMLPDIDGFEVYARLRQTSFTRHIPVIFLTLRDERANRVKGLALGADDYITKPFDIVDLKLRVQAVIARATRESLHEARTGLPTGALVREEINRRGQERDAPIFLTIDSFRNYRDVYGFIAANDVLSFAARVIREAISQLGTPDDFVGILDDQFVIFTHAPFPDRLIAEISRQFSEGVHAFYSYYDAAQGGMMVNDSADSEVFVPFMSLSAHS